jgi:hypothetical protein
MDAADGLRTMKAPVIHSHSTLTKKRLKILFFAEKYEGGICARDASTSKKGGGSRYKRENMIVLEFGASGSLTWLSL